VNIGLIPKDLDLQPAFNQGTPVLLTAPKMYAILGKKIYEFTLLLLNLR